MNKYIVFDLLLTSSEPLLIYPSNDNILMMYNGQMKRDLNLTHYTVQMLFPDYYQEFFDAFPVIYGNDFSVNRMQFVNENQNLLYKTFFEIYEKQMLIFKLMGHKMRLILLDISHYDQYFQPFR